MQLLRVTKRAVHTTKAQFDLLCKYPRFAKKVTPESIKLLSHPVLNSETLAGGNAIISYNEKFEDSMDIKSFMKQWATLGTLGCMHEVKDGDFKGEKVALTAYHVPKDGKIFYSWNGKRAIIGDEEGKESQLVNVWQKASFGDILAFDEVHDICAIKLTDNWENVAYDFIFGIGAVNVAPDDIGNALELLTQKSPLLGQGFISQTQPFTIDDIGPDNIWCDSPVTRCGFVSGDSGSGYVEVIDSEKRGQDKPSLVGIHVGQFATGINHVQQMLQYPNISNIPLISNDVMHTLQKQKKEPLKVKGIPESLLPSDAKIISPDATAQQVVKQPLKVIGIPENLTPAGSTIIPGDATEDQVNQLISSHKGKGGNK